MSKKQLGTIAECKFISRALENGLNVAQPIGDYCVYDLVVDLNGHLYKIQVKSTATIYNHASNSYYRILAGMGSKSKRIYTSSDVDYLAVYIHPANSWYIIPIEALENISVRLYPHRTGIGSYEQYREGWHRIGATE